MNRRVYLARRLSLQRGSEGLYVGISRESKCGGGPMYNGGHSAGDPSNPAAVLYFEFRQEPSSTLLHQFEAIAHAEAGYQRARDD